MAKAARRAGPAPKAVVLGVAVAVLLSLSFGSGAVANKATKKALARIPQIQKELATIRERSFKKKVPARAQTQKELRRYLKRRIREELPPEKSSAYSRSLYRVGLLKEPVDLASELENALVTQVAGYYDADAGRFFLVNASQDQSMLDTVIAHELAHALQDQHFDLPRYYQEGVEPGLTDDEIFARQFVVEGEATLLMTAHAVRKMLPNGKLGDDHKRLLETQMKAMAGLTVDELIRTAKLQAKLLGGDAEEVESAEKLDTIPRYILAPLLSSYTKGALPIALALRSGGWKAVDALYADPPQSTEQVLHPAKKLIGKRDYPVKLTIKQPKRWSGWKELASDSAGELLWRVYFDIWGVKKADVAAAGWDGDRYAVYASGEQVAAVVATTWDSEAEAREFCAAYRASLRKRFPKGELKSSRRKGKRGERVQLSRGDGTVVYLERRGSDVVIVDGAPAADAPGVLEEVVASLEKAYHPKDAR